MKAGWKSWVVQALFVGVALVVVGCGGAGRGANECHCTVGASDLACGEDRCVDRVGWHCGSDGTAVEQDGICACEPQCNGKACGPDGCGGECGTCKHGQCTDGACITEGEACDLHSDDDCASSERCVRGPSGSGVCSPDTQGTQCTTQFCSTGFVCAGKGTCLARCFYAYDCRGDEACLPTTNPDVSLCWPTCKALTSGCVGGEQCTGVIPTATGDLPTVCEAIGANVGGEACAQNAECGVGLGCVDEKCQRLCDTKHACPGSYCGQLSFGGSTSPIGVCAVTETPCTNISTACPDPNRRVCTVVNHQASCACNAGYTLDANGVCVDATPCAPNPCTATNRSKCVPDGLLYTCECNDGYALDGTGACVDATPCAPNPCTAAHKTQCTATGFTFACSCDAGYTDDGGVCKDATPCEPNPCTGLNKNQCTATGFSYTCGCNTGYAANGSGECVVSSCPGGVSHSTGDALEPNECAAQAATLTPTPAGMSPSVKSATIAPTNTDVDFYKVNAAPGHFFVIALDATAAMCTTVTNQIGGLAATNYDYFAEVDSAQFSCAKLSSQANNPSYSLAVVDFTLDSDYPSLGFGYFTPPVGRRWVANRIDTGDWDMVELTVTAPASIGLHGATLNVAMDLINPANGQTIQSLSQVCGGGITPTPCLDISGSGTVKVRLSIQAHTYPNLSVYRLGW